jgi:hypothetical protein
VTTQAREAPYFADDEECKNCPYVMPCVKKEEGEQARITRSTIFDCVYRGLSPEGSIPKIILDLENQVRKAADARYGVGTGQSLTGGMNNSRGEWLENILKLIFFKEAIEFNGARTVILKLPNASQLSFHDLYEERANNYLKELFASLKKRGIEMTMSNPDFVCVTNLPDNIDLSTESATVSEKLLRDLDIGYQKLLGLCSAKSIPFVLTVKTSTRSDRRYQIVHEANVVKSLVAHLAGRFWQQDLYTAFYAMISSNVSASDRATFHNPATHTLVQVNWNPVRLVDEVYQIDTVQGVRETVKELLEKHVR